MSDGPVELEPHVCRHCMGRIVSRGDTFLCSGCGQSCTGRPAGICGCGLTINGVRKRTAPYRCGPNPAPGPTSPTAYVVLFDGAPAAPGGKA